ncbi:CubicO group peptidase (beta-lactamase class C family) [Sphingomonas jejuensis]|uniref:CubicO group peptidase (Beta-lactamase class C family) n=1 Tax=Sphingomonas jejuensis TaxID=904715 RepID=A0ABX0XKL3_9SPHN|nr:CubicO group peptidase (beta-lactamase class C family) [Sphingomonas jejuensis]
MRITLVAAAAALLAAPVAAQLQPVPTPYDRAIAAGYKAAMLCSAIFNARANGAERTVESVERNELVGTYPEYDALLPTLTATVGADRVTVPFDDRLPPRVAIAQGADGCTNLPIGTDPALRPPSTAAARTRPAGRPPVVPEARGALRGLFDRAFAAGFGDRTNTVALLVMRDGRMIAERYADGYGPATPTRTWSVAKSIAGTVAGTAVARGLIDPAAPAPVPEWQAPGDPRAAITTEQLFRMASGLHSDTGGSRTDAIYFGGTAVTEETVAWPIEVPAGTRFRYANNDILLAIRGLRSRAGDDDFARTLLLDPLGLNGTFAEKDWRGNYVLSSQVWATARDLARLGQFWLDDGVVDGRRLLPEGWMRWMTAPAGPQPADGPGYGATLWLFGPAQGLPAGSYAAQGNRGQFIMVVPSARLVVVRRGEDPSGAGFDIARLTADVLQALE